MTRLLVLGDLHGQVSRLNRVLARVDPGRFDGVLLVGDLGVDLPHRRLASAVDVLSTVASWGRPVAYVPGNHDEPVIPAPPGCTCVDGTVALVAGVRVGGIGGAGPARFGFPYEWSEEDIRARPPLDAQVLLVHCPPRGTRLGLCAHGEDAGSQAIRERLVPGVRALACGHIHESAGFERVQGVACLNAGSLGRPYGAAQAAGMDLEPGRIRLWHQRFEEVGGADLLEHPIREQVWEEVP